MQKRKMEVQSSLVNYKKTTKKIRFYGDNSID